jgi:hypothetical protein
MHEFMWSSPKSFQFVGIIFFENIAVSAHLITSFRFVLNWLWHFLLSLLTHCKSSLAPQNCRWIGEHLFCSILIVIHLCSSLNHSPLRLDKYFLFDFFYTDDLLFQHNFTFDLIAYKLSFYCEWRIFNDRIDCPHVLSTITRWWREHSKTSMIYQKLIAIDFLQKNAVCIIA